MKILIKSLIAGGLLLTLLTGQSKMAPNIRFDQTAHDFKNVQPKANLKYVFKFKNTGTDTLKIIQLRPG